MAASTMRFGTGWIRGPGAATQTRTWTDPCPACGGEVTGFDAEPVTVTENPGAVIPLHDPACQWDEDDPGSPDCICSVLVNPAPDPSQDQVIVVGWRYLLYPCGHETGRIRVYQESRPVPGTYGAALAAWAALEG